MAPGVRSRAEGRGSREDAARTLRSHARPPARPPAGGPGSDRPARQHPSTQYLHSAAPRSRAVPPPASRGSAMTYECDATPLARQPLWRAMVTSVAWRPPWRLRRPGGPWLRGRSAQWGGGRGGTRDVCLGLKPSRSRTARLCCAACGRPSECRA